MRLPVLLLLLLAPPLTRADDPPFRVPEGFEVSLYAGDQLTHDTWALTIGPAGQVAVSGPGYIRILLDRNGDGTAEASHEVTGDARHAHGLLFVGNDLFSVQPHGVFRHRDANGDGLPEAPPELFYKLPGGGGEHGPHALRRGPDGWFYLACGNNTRIDKGNITTKTSPVNDPSQGTILRISPDGAQSEVIAHGFRNHYDLAFNQHGHLFTFDSDGERDHQLPWYSYCRVFHVRVGGHHGWLLPGHQRSFNRPPCFFDSVDRLIEIDRGSPTGVEVYRHTQFPERYRSGLFFACWTYGRVYFSPLLASGETYERHPPETFLETTGNAGFAPSDLAVHPQSGDLYVSIGGRGTRGAVYRVSFPAGREQARPLPAYEVADDWSIHDQRITLPPTLAPEEALALFRSSSDPESRLTAIRHFMLALGDISTSEASRRIDAGYTATRPDAIDPSLRKRLIASLRGAFRISNPASPDLNREIARLLAMLQANDERAVQMLALAINPTSHPSDDAHYLFCLAQMAAPRSTDTRRRIGWGFLQIDQKLAERELLTDRNWAINIREAFQVHLDLDAGLAPFVARDEAAERHPSQAYLLKMLPKAEQAATALPMLKADTGWSAESIAFVQSHLPPERLLPRFRELWETPALRPALAPFLSKHGELADVRMVDRFYRPPSSEVDLSPFKERYTRVDWATGDSKRGQAVYARLTCATCHDGNTRLGPRLNGIAKRFNRDDLFRHINEPNLAVSDLYKATQITTKDGTTHVGVPVYKSESQTILETGAGETIRFSRQDIVSERRPNQSPMPAGLLLGASTGDLADLYAYLQSF